MLFLHPGHAQNLIVVETLAALLTKPTSIHHTTQETSRSVLAVTSLLVKNVHDCKACVEANEISQNEGAHGHVGASLHNVVNILTATNTSLQTNHGLVDVRHQDTVGKEARCIGRHRGHLTHSLDKGNGSVHGLLGCLESPDNLYTLLDGNRVHEVR